jgi:GTP-binding protein
MTQDRHESGLEPVVALIGRPNVGKSTLFNELTRSRDALVADHPGLTRDRQYGRGVVGDSPYIVIDTGGMGEVSDPLTDGMAEQARQALDEADAVLLLVDGRSGMTAADEVLAQQLRRQGMPVTVVVNKTDGVDDRVAASEFHALGLGEPIAIAAAHGAGVGTLIQTVLTQIPRGQPGAPPVAEAEDAIRVAVIGRPNVGKSTLVNRLLGDERVLVYDEPGTTRDSVFVPFERDGQAYTLIDTAGVRRRSRVTETVEKFSVIKTMQAIQAAHVVVMVVDAQDSISEQDAHLIGHVLDAGRALVLAVNKWDGLSREQKTTLRRQLDLRLGFVDFARTHHVSALHGTGVGKLFDSVQRGYRAAMMDISTSELTRLLTDAVEANQPPLVRGRRVKLRYAHQGGRNPPLIVIHGNQAERLSQTYQRYLINTFRRELDLWGTPVRLELNTTDNPYSDRPQQLNKRQKDRRQRLIKHARKNRARRKRR